MEYQWKKIKSGPASQVQMMANELSIDQSLAEMLVQRGITSFALAKDFFRPQLSQIHDPFLMKDMDIAVARIEEAFSSKERIMVYGDYDVDGTTAVALVSSFLKKHSK